jgi:hypothetical protein
MAISCKCDACGKTYTVDEKLAGKRVKCKNCGEAFSVPSTRRAPTGFDDDDDSLIPMTRRTPPQTSPTTTSRATAARGAESDPPDLSDLSAFEPDADDTAGPPQSGLRPPAKTSRAPATARREPRLADDDDGFPPPKKAAAPVRRARAESSDDADPLLAGPSKPSVKFVPPPADVGFKPKMLGKDKNAALNMLLETVLPWTLILIGYGLPLALTYRTLIGQIDPGSQTLFFVLLGVAFLVGPLFIMTPLALLGLNTAANSKPFHLRSPLIARVLAAFSLVPLTMWLTLTMQSASLPTTGTLVGGVEGISLTAIPGLVIGVAAAFFLIWLFFLLKPANALSGFIASTIGYLFGLVLTLLVCGCLVAFTPLKPAFQAIYDAGNRAKTQANLNAIAQGLETYLGQNDNHYPPALGALSDAGLIEPAALNSPYGHASSGADYAYRYFDKMRGALPQQTVIAYDKSQFDHAGPTDPIDIVAGDGTLTQSTKGDFDKTIKIGNKAMCMAVFNRFHDWIDTGPNSFPPDSGAAGNATATAAGNTAGNATAAATAGGNSAGAGPTTGPDQSFGNGGPPVAAAPPAPAPVVASIKPVPTNGALFGSSQPSVASVPSAPAAAWKATPDVLKPYPSFSPTVRVVFPNAPQDILYCGQPSNYVVVGADFNNVSGSPGDLHTCFNLHEQGRAGEISGALPLTHMILSPDGQYLAGCASGGQGMVTIFDIWSFRTESKAQSLTAPAVTGVGDPQPIGFLGDKQILTLGDTLQVWNIKTGDIARQVSLAIPRTKTDLVAVSATGKLVAIFDGKNRIEMVDALEGKSLGFAVVPNYDGERFGLNVAERSLAFSPDGKELALFLPADQPRLIVFKVADGSIASDFQLPPTLGGFTGFNPRKLSMSWLPTGDGWLVNNKFIVDRVTGTVIYEIPDHTEPFTSEYGRRTIVGTSRIIYGLKAIGGGLGMISLPLAGDDIAKARGAARGMSAPAAPVLPSH